MMRKLLYILLFCISLLLLLYSCADEPARRPAPGKSEEVKKVAVAPPQKEKAGEEAEKKPAYFYDPTGKRDPFLPFIAIMPFVDKGGQEEAQLTELQKYQLSQLKLVAIMKVNERRLAMVEDPEGKGHTLYVGTLVGRNNGKVTAIEEKKVVIEEKRRDILGNITTQIKELVIKSPEGGGNE